jgi:phosphoribosylanthranilate isomerase
MENLKIKICGMRVLENISRLLELGPDYMGFIFYDKSPRYVKDELSGDEMKLLAGKVKKVGVFVNADLSEIIQIKHSWQLDTVQLHGDESPALCQDLKKTGLEVVKVFNISESFDFRVLKDYISVSDFFLFDTKTHLHGGSGEKFKWDILDKYSLDKPFFLSGGIQPSDLDSILSINHPSLYGIDVNSGFEVRPGYKDISKLQVFINQLRNI